MEGESIGHSRAKRQKIDKSGKLSAFQKLKELKGKKHKYDLEGHVDSVYDIVDEAEFEKRARENNLDWIEEDGSGYVEDGRDIFEDSDDYSDDDASSKDKNSQKRKRKDNEKTAKNSLHRLFSNAAAKKTVSKEMEPRLEDDVVLQEILNEIRSKKGKSSKSGSNLNENNEHPQKIFEHKTSKTDDEKITKECVENFIQSIKNSKKEQPKIDLNQIDKEIFEKIQSPKIICSNSTATVTKQQTENKIGSSDIRAEIVEEKTNVVNAKDMEKRSVEVEKKQDFVVIDKDMKENKDLNNKMESNLLDELFETDFDCIDMIPADTVEENSTKTTSEIEEKLIDDNKLKIWFLDAWEDSQKSPGQLFLFGRILEKSGKESKSICIHVENIDRVMYLLPREYMLDPISKEKTNQPVTFKDMYEEFRDEIAKDHNIEIFSSRKVTKNFAFHTPGVIVPESCEYLEIRYEGKKRSPDVRKKYKTIAHIFGTNTSSTETFLLERKIKGPSWLNVTNFRTKQPPSSWCKVEIVCPSMDSITVATEEMNTSPPPIAFFGINVKTVLHPKTLKNEIVMISCLINEKFHIDKPPPKPPVNKHLCGFTCPSTLGWPYGLSEKLANQKFTKTMKLDSERALLSWFLAIYQTADPDLIVTYDAEDCQLDVLVDRIAVLKIPMWSRLGKLKISQIAGKKFKDCFVGRMICDVKQSAEELVKLRSYDLMTLCTNILKKEEDKLVELSNNDIFTFYESGEGILKLIKLTMQDALLVIRLMYELNVLPLALQITSICGNLMSRTLQGGRSERNEFLLLHAFSEKNYIVPDKRTKEANLNNMKNSQAGGTNRKKAAYAGGLVLEPKKGFYDKFVLLMDFNSLYPSIIQEYNICFTTITEPEDADEIPPLPDSNAEQGILPRQIRRLVESRREVKKLMTNSDLEPEQKMQYNIRQLALKLTANSMYGCLGFSHSRFFAQHLAALVTYKGREILTNTKSLVEKMNFSVIYGDTDSIMVNTNCTDYEQVFKIGQNIKQTVNKVYRQIELDIDGIFKYLLLLKKKKYAAVLVTRNKTGEFCYVQEHKGLDIVRRDWSQISVITGKMVLDEILSDNQLDTKIDNIHSHLEKIKENIINGTVPLSLLTITKQLTKSLREYTSVSILPHVQVALRMNTERNKRYKKGDMVSYIICEDGTNNAPMQRAYHLDELKSNPKLKVDVMYYLAQQIHPVISRLCEPLEGTDSSRIATCLGLDPNKFKGNTQRLQKYQTGNDEEVIQIVKTTFQKYRECEKFKFTCISCKTENLVASAFKLIEKTGCYIGVLEKCTNDKCTVYPYQYVRSIQNELTLAIRQCIRRYYENWMVCDDPTCNQNTRFYSHLLKNNRPLCIKCKYGALIKQYSERDLFNQLNYFQYMFDLSKHEKKSANCSIEVQSAYNILKETVDQFLQNSQYNVINLSRVFMYHNHAIKFSNNFETVEQ